MPTWFVERAAVDRSTKTVESVDTAVAVALDDDELEAEIWEAVGRGDSRQAYQLNQHISGPARRIAISERIAAACWHGPGVAGD